MKILVPSTPPPQAQAAPLVPASEKTPGQVAKDDQYGQPLHPKGVGAPETANLAPLVLAMERLLRRIQAIEGTQKALQAQTAETRVKAAESVLASLKETVTPERTPRPEPAQDTTPAKAEVPEPDSKGMFSKLWRYINQPPFD